MKRVFVFCVFAFGLLLNSCDSGQDPSANQVVPDKVLAASGREEEEMFFATGEVVIFFQPSRDKISDWKGDKDSLVKALGDYTNASTSAQKALAGMGISSYNTDKSDVKVNISEQKFYVVNAAASKDGFGFIMTKLGEQPKVSLGAFTSEQVIEQAKAFYKK